MRRATQQTISFFLIDSSAPPARKTGAALASSDIKLSKDGGAFASATNVPAEVSLGWYSLVLTAAESDCFLLAIEIEKAGIQPQSLAIDFGPYRSASVVSATSASLFVTNLINTTDDYWKDALIKFTTGVNAEQVKKIAGYNGATKAITTVSAFTNAPSAADLFLLIDQ